jgi:hypothetical protein
MTIEIYEDVDDTWDNLLLKSDMATIYQTKGYAEIVSTINKIPLFLKFLDPSGNIIGQLLITIESQLSKKKFVGNLLKNLFPSIGNIYTWTYGPIIFDNNYDVYDELEKFLLSKKCSVSGWGHPFHHQFPTPFKKLKINNWSTFLIDLSLSKFEIYQNIDKHSGRKNIERSEKRGVKIEEINENNLIDYVNLVNDERKLEKREFLDYDYMLKSWRACKKYGYSGFIARKDEIPIGGLLFSYVNGHIIEGGVARSLIDKKDNLYSQDLIKWNIIKWGIENKMKFYNLAGFNPHPELNKEKGIFRYKKKWGGNQYDYWRMQTKF